MICTSLGLRIELFSVVVALVVVVVVVVGVVVMVFVLLERAIDSVMTARGRLAAGTTMGAAAAATGVVGDAVVDIVFFLKGRDLIYDNLNFVFVVNVNCSLIVDFFICVIFDAN